MTMRTFFLLGIALLSGGCEKPPSPVVGGRQLCSDGTVDALSDAGEQALCLTPILACDPATDVESVSLCHPPPAASPSRACCDLRPAGCAPTDCDCLLRDGPWIDYVLAADGGVPWPYSGPKRACSYRVSCAPAADGGVAVLTCTPA